MPRVTRIRTGSRALRHVPPAQQHAMFMPLSILGPRRMRASEAEHWRRDLKGNSWRKAAEIGRAHV